MHYHADYNTGTNTIHSGGDKESFCCCRSFRPSIRSECARAHEQEPWKTSRRRRPSRADAAAQGRADGPCCSWPSPPSDCGFRNDYPIGTTLPWGPATCRACCAGCCWTCALILFQGVRASVNEASARVSHRRGMAAGRFRHPGPSSSFREPRTAGPGRSPSRCSRRSGSFGGARIAVSKRHRRAVADRAARGPIFIVASASPFPSGRSGRRWICSTISPIGFGVAFTPWN